MRFQKRITLLVLVCLSAPILLARQAPRVWTVSELFTRNVGTTEQQNKQFPPHKIVGNVYYVGTETLASFLVTTPQGHVADGEASERLPLRQVRLLETQSKARNSTSITAAIPATAITVRPEHGPSSATGATCRQKPDLSRSFDSAQIERRSNPRPPCQTSPRKL